MTELLAGDDKLHDCSCVMMPVANSQRLAGLEDGNSLRDRPLGLVIVQLQHHLRDRLAAQVANIGVICESCTDKDRGRGHQQKPHGRNQNHRWCVALHRQNTPAVTVEGLGWMSPRAND